MGGVTRQYMTHFRFFKNVKNVDTGVITHWEKLLHSDWLRHCEFIRNLRANSVFLDKLQISRAKSVIQSESYYRKELTINN